MKKQLLTLVALLFAAVTAMAQVNLGNPKWNVKDGGKCSPSKSLLSSSQIQKVSIRALSSQ